MSDYPVRPIRATLITEHANDPRAALIAETLGRTGVIHVSTPLAATDEPEDLFGALRRERAHPELIPDLILICVGDGAGPASAVTDAITAELGVARRPVRALFDHLWRDDRPSRGPSVWRLQEAVHDASLPADAMPIFGTNRSFAYQIAPFHGPILVALPGDARALPFVLARVLDALMDSGLFRGSLRTLWMADTAETRKGLEQVFHAARRATDWPLLPTAPIPDWGSAVNRLDVVIPDGADTYEAARRVMTAAFGTQVLDISPPAFLGRMWSGATLAVVEADMCGRDLATHLAASGRLQEVRRVRPRAADFAAGGVEGLADIAVGPEVDWAIAVLPRETD